MGWYVPGKFIFSHSAVVAAYACSLSVCYYQMGYLEHQIVSECLLQYSVAELYLRSLAFNNDLGCEALVKDNNVAAEALVSKLYCVLAGHKLQGIFLLCMQPMDKMLSYLLLGGKGHVLFA